MIPGVSLQDGAVEQPILRLGLAGFSREQFRQIHAATSRRRGVPEWCISPLEEADAWMVNGAKVKMSPDGIVRVLPGNPIEHSVKLDPHDMRRPIAFAAPVASPDIEAQCTFDAGSASSIRGTLLQFENWLEPARVFFALGGEVVRMGAQLRHGVFHVSRGSTLLAALDFRNGRAAVSTQAQPADFAGARWDKRPAGAGAVPPSFIATSPAELAWSYARRSRKELLPERYFERLVHFRGLPKVPVQWLGDSHLMLLRELASGPSSCNGLQRRTGLAHERLVRDLACLFFAGSITTSPAKAARTNARYADGPQSSGPGLEPFDSVATLVVRADPTVPAPLRALPAT